MTQPLVTRPSYGTPQGEAKLPEGEPADRGVPLDEDVSGQRTFAKPQDDETGYPPTPPHNTRVRVPEWSSFVDSEGYGDGATDKTKYPYRDGIPNTHNASVEFVRALYDLETAPTRLFHAAGDVRVASTADQILSGLDPKFQQRAQACRADLKRADIKNMRWIFSVNCGNGIKAVKMRAVRPRSNVTAFGKMDLELSCSCPAWRWLGPEFHAKSDDYLLGKPQGTASTPNIKDPERDNFVCKHVAAALAVARGWTMPKAKKPKKAAVTEAYRHVEDLLNKFSEPLGKVSRQVFYSWQKGMSDEVREKTVQDLRTSASELLGALEFEFEDPEYGKRVLKRLRRIGNFRKMLTAYTKVRTWEDLEAVIKKQSTKSKTVWEKFWEYKKDILGVIAGLDVEKVESFITDNYSVTMFSSPRGDWSNAKVEALKEVLKATNRILSGRGLSAVTGGKVYAYPGTSLPASSRTSGSALASYSIKTDVIRLSANENVREVTRDLIHELGHRAYFKVIGSNGRAAWQQFFGENVKPLNIDGLLRKWASFLENPPEDWEAQKYGRYLGYYLKYVDKDDQMWLNLIAHKLGIEEGFNPLTGSPKKGLPGYDQLLARRDEVEVFLYPVTAYSGTDPEELFAETFSHYAMDGPGRIPEIVRYAFQQALPQFKVATMKMET